MSVNFRPLHDRVVIDVSEADKMSAGGIVLPNNDERHSGTVVATGPGKETDGKLSKPNVTAGDKVMFGKYSGTEIKIDGKDYLVMKEEDIIGVIES